MSSIASLPLAPTFRANQNEDPAQVIESSDEDIEESSNTSYEYEAGKIMQDSDDEEGYGYGRWGDYSAPNSRLMATKGKIDGKTVEQHRRAFGDKFKEQINFAKYANTPACNVNIACSVDIFRGLIAPHASKLIPRKFDENTPVVVAELKTPEKVSKVFGHIGGGMFKGRYIGGQKIRRCDVVFLPSQKQVRVWWTMA